MRNGFSSKDEGKMPDTRLGLLRLLALAMLAALVLWPGLGNSGRLSYHEAFVAQGAREMLESGSWATPTIGGLPWLEKPPLPWWLVAGVGSLTGGIDEVTARLPTTLAAIGLVLGVAILGARHYGPTIGLMAGAIQATTAWVAMRGRLAEADMLLACLITWAIVTFDAMSSACVRLPTTGKTSACPLKTTRWAFFILLGTLSLVKGIGFGAVLVLSVVAASLVANRNRDAVQNLRFLPGWLFAVALAAAWPVAMLIEHGTGALSLWTLHVADRLATHPGAFASEPWWQYAWGIMAQGLPWTPLAITGAWPSFLRAVGRGGKSKPFTEPALVRSGDRLLWVWAVVPMALLAMATVKNAHYAISAQVPWSIWAAMGLSRCAARLERRGWTQSALARSAWLGFITLASVYGLGVWLLGSSFDRRGVEWAFYQTAARTLPADAPLTLLYDDWDRNPYESPFGAIPHDLAVRLFYLGRPAAWHFGTDQLAIAGLTATGSRPPTATALYVIGRDRDTRALERLGHVDTIAHGPPVRFDRTYTLFRVTPASPEIARTEHAATR